MSGSPDDIADSIEAQRQKQLRRYLASREQDDDSVAE